MNKNSKSKTYVYKDKNLVATLDSATAAAEFAYTKPTIVSECANGKRLNTYNGWWFSYKPLTKEELEDIYTPKEKRPRATKEECTEKLSPRQEFAVDCDSREIFYLERSRKARVHQLRRYLYNALDERWFKIPTKLSNLEKRFIKEILDSLE